LANDDDKTNLHYLLGGISMLVTLTSSKRALFHSPLALHNAFNIVLNYKAGLKQGNFVLDQVSNRVGKIADFGLK